MMKLGNRSLYWLACAMLVAGALCAVCAAILIIHGRQTPAHPPGAAQPAPSAHRPSPKSISRYQVPPDNPKYISLPTIGLSTTRVIQLGVTKNDQIAAPGNIYDAGWYEGSAKPGQPGAMFAYGHVSSRVAKGAFYNLKKLRPGDTVLVTRGDGKLFTYRVALTRIYPVNKVDMRQVLAPIDPAKPGLNLMTCTGAVIKGTNDFNERLVVFTSLSER